MAALACLVCLGGCVDAQGLRGEINRAARVAADLHADLGRREADIRLALERAEGDPERRALLGAELELVSAQRRAIGRSLEGAGALGGSSAGGAADAIGRVVGVVAPFAPEPVRLPLVLGAGLVAAVLRAAQLRRAGRSIARGVQRALDADAVLGERFAAHADAVRTEQGGLARRLVDEAQRRRARLPL